MGLKLQFLGGAYQQQLPLADDHLVAAPFAKFTSDRHTGTGAGTGTRKGAGVGDNVRGAARTDSATKHSVATQSHATRRKDPTNGGCV